MSNIIPVFSTHYNFDFSSILTLEEAEKTAKGNPSSICDIAKNNNLKEVIIVDERIDGFIEGYKNLSKINVQMIFGIKLTVCADHNDKSEESSKTESKIIILIKNSDGYSDLIKIYNKAWTENFYNKGRTSWKQLKELWTDNLLLAMPFFSSFIAKNTLTFNSIIPDFPVKPIFFKEIDSGLPFEKLIEDAVIEFTTNNKLEIQNIKTIYYEKSSDFDPNAIDFDIYTTFRAIGNRGQYQRPGVDHLCSDKFSFENYKSLIT